VDLVEDRRLEPERVRLEPVPRLRTVGGLLGLRERLCLVDRGDLGDGRLLLLAGAQSVPQRK
jgi:hypothetical protein